ncbi:DNA primase [Desulfococcaceae bacterium HSG8]|nr:DNA primase [Desulfococcaceae bacterium HSG8]
MTSIPEDKISDVRNAADIVEIISESVILKKTGKDYVGLCPFHSEKTPSFTVSPEKQMFYCFGCGVGGNVFTFLMKQEGHSFPEAVKTLAGRCGIEIPLQHMSPEQKRKVSEREHLLAVNQEASGFFRNSLGDNTAGKRAVTYLDERGITRETADRFDLGYAPDGWSHLTDLFFRKRIPHTLVERCGLIVPRKNKNGFYDRFRNRIIFPITDARTMQVIGFGGRVLDDSLPKYLNSPETPLYNKSRSLYGLHLSKQECRRSGVVYLVEGYFDVLALYQHGIKNAAATLGTSLTREHVRLLKGYTSKIVLVYDSDQAGIKAAMRSVGVFRDEKADASVLVLPSGHDPDSFVFRFGPEAFRDAAGKALSVMSFLTDVAVKKHGLSVEGKMRIISDMKVPLSSINDHVERALYIREIAELINIDEAVITEKTGSPARAVPGYSDNSGNMQENSREKGSRMEQQIIAMMLQFPEIMPDTGLRNILGQFENDTLKSMGRKILNYYDSSTSPRISEIIGLFKEEEEVRVIAFLASKKDSWDREGCLKLISQFETMQNRHKNHALLQEIKAAEAGNDHELLLELLKKKQTEARQRQLIT